MMFSDQFENKKVLVTGGAGFIGSNIVHSLLAQGALVRVLDDFSTGHEDNLPVDPGMELVRGSVTDSDLVRSVVKGMDIVIHEAARNIIVSMRNPREDFEVNIGGTLNILLAVREWKVPRVVYASSVSVYGNSRYLPVNEDDATNMLSPYAVSKYAGENYCKAFYESYSVSTTVMRYSNVYGLRQRPDNPYCGVIARFFEAARRGEKLNIHGDGAQTRDFTYIDDVVAATLQAAVSQKSEGEIYNVGTGCETSINTLARWIIDMTKTDANIDYVDRRDIDNIRRRVVNIEKIRRELKWVPLVTLEKGLQRTCDWVVNNSNRG